MTVKITKVPTERGAEQKIRSQVRCPGGALERYVAATPDGVRTHDPWCACAVHVWYAMLPTLR